MAELEMNDNEVKFMKRKVLKSTVFTIVFSLFLAAFYIGWNHHEPSIIVSAIVILLFLVIIFFYFAKLISTQKDIKERIKVVGELRIIDKYTGGADSNSRTYKIIFDSKILYSYEVIERVYDELNIDDIIDVEYTKHAIWILSIKSKGMNIENKSFMA